MVKTRVSTTLNFDFWFWFLPTIHPKSILSFFATCGVAMQPWKPEQCEHIVSEIELATLSSCCEHAPLLDVPPRVIHNQQSHTSLVEVSIVGQWYLAIVEWNKIDRLPHTPNSDCKHKPRLRPIHNAMSQPSGSAWNRQHSLSYMLASRVPYHFFQSQETGWRRVSAVHIPWDQHQCNEQLHQWWGHLPFGKLVLPCHSIHTVCPIKVI